MDNPKVPWKNIIIFCVLAYALLWTPFFGATLSERAGGDAGVWGSLLGLLGPFSPLIAALIVRLLVAREGFKDARLGLRSVKWYYWALAILLPFFWNGFQDALQLMLGYTTMDWARFGEGLYRVPINLLGGIIIFIGEEFGWRSYLLEKLRPLGRWRALLISGVIWSLWHLPLVAIPNASYGNQIGFWGTILALLIFVLAGFIFGWLYLEGGSLWPCVLMHSYNNLIGMKLFSEGWQVINEPGLLQNSLMAIAPIFLVWLVLFLRKSFQGPAVNEYTIRSGEV